MATNLALDRDLLDHAFRLSGEPTKKAAVTLALQEFIAASETCHLCRRCGIQIGTIDALLIQLRQRYNLRLLTTDKDCQAASQWGEFRCWPKA